ncbi:MAG: hypothetical protein QOF78_27 [Phycisphaerales bacterium]|jgi:Ca2+-binding RTX toxin-like protein|nr:hypothetical protein [Phycisphaerales bacterium]
MFVQGLESRRLLSTAVVTSGVLVITGTDANNFITMNFNGPLNRVLVNDSTASGPSTQIGSFPPASFTKISVKLLGGNDFLSISYIEIKPMTIDGGAGNDQMAGGDGADNILGGLGNDVITAAKGNDVVDGGDGDDNLLGGFGNDILKGGAGVDVLGGQQDSDLLDGGTSGDQLRGGEGIDTVTYAGRLNPVTVDITDSTTELPDDGELGEKDFVHADVENVIGGNGNDRLTGTVLIGTVFTGFTKNNKLVGGPGLDMLNGLDGNDVLDGGTGKDNINGGLGIDTVDYTGRPEALKITLDGVANDGAPLENDLIAADIENATGGNGRDAIFGNAGANALNGGSGDDLLDGLLGADKMNGGSGIDTVTYASRAAAVNASIDNVANDGQVGELDNIQADVENLIGGSGNDNLSGSAGNNALTGGSGNDNLKGGAGNDLLDGGIGQDIMLGEAGIDTVTYASRLAPVTVKLDALGGDGQLAENDTVKADVENVIGGNGADIINGSAVANVLNGGPGNDVIRGGDGNDSITGGTGVDQLFGDAGNDTFFARDTSSDKVDGGLGTDSAQINAGDILISIEMIIP